MKAFVFNPTDKNIGKFKLKSLNEIEAATKDFIQKSGDVPDFSYIQVGLDTWTISSTTPFTLLAGRLTYDSIVRAEAEVEAHNRHFDALLEKCLASGQDERGLSSLSWKDLQEVVDLSRSFLNHSFSPTSQKQEDDVYELVKMVLRDATASRMLEVSTLLKIEAQTSEVGAKIEGLTGATQNIGSTAKTATRSGMLAASLGIQKMDDIIDGIEGD
ncbi:hypothetical protein N9Z91_07470 [Akkermansiaceae bacterium]|nr:hypothetical protein [Akkermansiaceae bacterium]MDB4575237.1 hypothetical protein [Akkermansiaceae bacterium]